MTTGERKDSYSDFGSIEGNEKEEEGLLFEKV